MKISQKQHIRKGVRLLKDILASHVCVESFSDDAFPNSFDPEISLFFRSILWMLKDRSSLHQMILLGHGIKEEGEGIFFAYLPVYRLLLEDTDWRCSDIVPMLERLPNAVRTTRRIRGRVLKGIFFPNKEEVLALSGRSG